MTEQKGAGCPVAEYLIFKANMAFKRTVEVFLLEELLQVRNNQDMTHCFNYFQVKKKEEKKKRKEKEKL